MSRVRWLWRLPLIGFIAANALELLVCGARWSLVLIDRKRNHPPFKFS